MSSHEKPKVDDWLLSIPLYDAMAKDYDASFDELGHRRAYELLAGEFIAALLPTAPGMIVDVGCGTGRWAERWLSLGHKVIGIEQSPAMIQVLAQRNLGSAFVLINADMQRAEIPSNSADLVVAMGSVQYAPDPAAMIQRFADWAKPGGFVCVYTDSLMALVLDLIRCGKREEAILRLRSRRGIFAHGGFEAELHLYDRDSLIQHLAAAGLQDISCRGLLVTGSVWGPLGSAAAADDDWQGLLNLERALSQTSVMADAGKHLIAAGRKVSNVSVAHSN